MARLLSPEDIARLQPSELLPERTPLPTQVVASDEFQPPPQSRAQRQVEQRLVAMADRLAPHQGLTRRRFFQTAAGMAGANPSNLRHGYVAAGRG